MNEFDADLAARFAIELAKNEALRRCVAAAADTDTARLIWSLGFVTGKESGLAQAQQIMAGKP